MDLNFCEARDDGGGSGVSWMICTSFAPCARQIITSAPHHSIFTGPCSSCYRANSVKALKAKLPDIIGGKLRWLVSLVVRVLDSQLDGPQFDSWQPQLVLGWVSIFGCAFHHATQANSASYPVFMIKRYTHLWLLY